MIKVLYETHFPVCDLDQSKEMYAADMPSG